MKSRLSSVVLAVCLACAAAPACETFGSSKVAQGQLYKSGDGRYDPFFESVHQQQIEASSWSDDRRGARKPITVALDVTPNASESTILEALRARAKTNGDAEKLVPAVQETMKADAERAQKLRAAADKLDALTKEGREHAEEARREYDNRGADKADEQKSERMRDVRRELNAATDVCDGLARDARKLAQDAERFGDDMERALGGNVKVERPAPGPKKDEPAKDDAKKAEDKKKPDGKKDEKKPTAETKPKPKPLAPKPAPKPADEVFNP